MQESEIELEMEVKEFVRTSVRHIYSRIFDVSRGDKATFQKIAAIAARQIAKETVALLGDDKALNTYRTKKYEEEIV